MNRLPSLPVLIAVVAGALLAFTGSHTSAAAQIAQDGKISKVTQIVSYGLAQDPTGDHLGLCAALEDFAKNVMTARQEGASLAKLVATVNSPSPGDGGAMQEIVVQAYEHPRLSSEESRSSAVNDFGNEIYLDCLKARP